MIKSFSKFFHFCGRSCKKVKIINRGKDNDVFFSKNKSCGTLKIIGNSNTFLYFDKKNVLKLNVQIRGNNNNIVIGKDFETSKNSVNTANLEENLFVLNIDLYGDNNNFVIGCGVDGTLTVCIEGGIFKVSNCSLIIGNNTHIGHPAKMIFEEDGTQIKIGRDCMFSENIEFWCSDTHSVLDKDTDVILNKGNDICIGNYVWIARDAHFNKNTAVADNSIVGHHSIVTKKFTEANIIIAGNPAKKCKENVTWNWFRPDLYERRNDLNNVNKKS